MRRAAHDRRMPARDDRGHHAAMRRHATRGMAPRPRRMRGRCSWNRRRSPTMDGPAGREMALSWSAMDRPNVAVTPRRPARGGPAPPGAGGCGDRPSRMCTPQMPQGQGCGHPGLSWPTPEIPVVSPRCFRQPHLPHGLVAGVALPPTGDQGKALARQHLIRPPAPGRCRGACGVPPPPGGDHLAPLIDRRGGAQQPDRAGGVCRARQVDTRPREPGALLGHLCAALEPDEVRQSRTARGLRAVAEDVGIQIPARNDPHETPFHDRSDVMVGGIIASKPPPLRPPWRATREATPVIRPGLQGEGPSTSAAMTRARRRVGEGLSPWPFKQASVATLTALWGASAAPTRPRGWL
jgi:hypothetical protein